jgi:hypothetical protein
MEKKMRKLLLIVTLSISLGTLAWAQTTNSAPCSGTAGSTATTGSGDTQPGAMGSSADSQSATSADNSMDSTGGSDAAMQPNSDTSNWRSTQAQNDAFGNGANEYPTYGYERTR